MVKTLSLATIENVTLGHPDRQTELIADAVLDEMIKITPDARVAIEITGTGNNIAIGGEVNSQGHEVDMDALLRRAVDRVLHKQKLGDFAKELNIINMVKEQSSEITQLVEQEDDVLGAGDQGHMWSYALNAPEYNYLPEAFWLTEVIQRLRDEDYYNNPETFLGADAKVQMTWNPLDGKIYSVVMSTQHDEGVDLDELREYVKTNFIKPALGDLWHDDIKLYINYAGSFVLGGIQADSSAVGRKLAITTAMGTVGGYLNNGSLDLTKIPMSGGASSGKDATKVDRSGHLMARYIAKNIVASLGIKECLVQLSYVIGRPEPTSILIQSDELDDEQIQTLVEQVCEQVDLTPSGIIKRFNLLQPIWTDVTWDGQFNNPDRPWEQLDLEFKL